MKRAVGMRLLQARVVYPLLSAVAYDTDVNRTVIDSAVDRTVTDSVADRTCPTYAADVAGLEHMSAAAAAAECQVRRRRILRRTSGLSCNDRICNCMIFDHAFAYAFVACTTLAVSAAAAAAAAAAMCVP